MEAANRDGISREAARQMRNLADAFNAQMHETTNASGQDLKEPWLNAFLFMNKIRDEIDVVDKRGRVTPAHNGRRKPKINELISARCEDLWKKQPGLRDNPYRTACEILEALNDDLKIEPSIKRKKIEPSKKRWLPIDLTDEGAVKTRRNTIRGRIEKLLGKTHKG
jgi:hypothetical protein